jgi:single-stranded-DNA-specific exonuclease
MERDSGNAFMKAQELAVGYFKKFPKSKATLVHHNDTDGIASGAILKRALEREGWVTENIPVERIHPLFLPRIHTFDRNFIFYADLGGQAASMIEARVLPGTGVIILDHHPPSLSSLSRLLQVNPEILGIDGDLRASAASVAFFWARALSANNDDLAYLAIIGAIGDHQTVEGEMIGLNALACEIALKRGEVHISRQGSERYRFPRLDNAEGGEVSREIIDLAVNGYYQGGADMALQYCLEGPTVESRDFAARMRKIQEGRFKKEKREIQAHGISLGGNIQWVDVEDRFHPLGLKSIGIFCEEIIQEKIARGNLYVAGFMNYPGRLPKLGTFAWEDIKVSLRVPPALRRKIENGEQPNLAELLPPAAERAGGFAEGCHRFSAACTIPKDRKPDFLRALNDKLVHPDS